MKTMGLFNRKKKDEKKDAQPTPVSDAAEKPSEKAPKVAAKKASPKRAGEGTGDAYRILLRPIVTEKSMKLSESGQYVFEVAPGANKIAIKKAVKAVYGVDPTDVAVMRVLGRPSRSRYGKGRRKHWRKAIVTLKKGQTIEVFTTKA